LTSSCPGPDVDVGPQLVLDVLDVSRLLLFVRMQSGSAKEAAHPIHRTQHTTSQIVDTDSTQRVLAHVANNKRWIVSKSSTTAGAVDDGDGTSVSNRSMNKRPTTTALDEQFEYPVSLFLNIIKRAQIHADNEHRDK